MKSLCSSCPQTSNTICHTPTENLQQIQPLTSQVATQSSKALHARRVLGQNILPNPHSPVTGEPAAVSSRPSAEAGGSPELPAAAGGVADAPEPSAVSRTSVQKQDTTDSLALWTCPYCSVPCRSGPAWSAPIQAGKHVLTTPHMLGLSSYTIRHCALQSKLGSHGSDAAACCSPRRSGRARIMSWPAPSAPSVVAPTQK